MANAIGHRHHRHRHYVRRPKVRLGKFRAQFSNRLCSCARTSLSRTSERSPVRACIVWSSLDRSFVELRRESLFLLMLFGFFNSQDVLRIKLVFLINQSICDRFILTYYEITVNISLDWNFLMWKYFIFFRRYYFASNYPTPRFGHLNVNIER